MSVTMEPSNERHPSDPLQRERVHNYLRTVQMSGEINMYDAWSKLMTEFFMTKDEAHAALQDWFENYDEY